VNAHDVAHRRREHAVRIGVAEVRLGREGKLREVGERPQIVGVGAVAVELDAVMLDVVIGVADRPLQALELQGLQFLAAGGLDRFQPDRL